MTHTYTITGMTCTGCIAKVQKLLGQVSGVKDIKIDLAKEEAVIGMERHIATDVLQSALKEHPKYQLSEAATVHPVGKPGGVAMTDRSGVADNDSLATSSWWVTYKPILLILGYITAISLIAATREGMTGHSGSALAGSFDGMLAMRVFMSGFFLTFSFFKMLDLRGFAESYAMYDIVARRFKNWGYVYGFIEGGLGLSYALNFQPLLTNLVTLVVMTVSIIGVLQSVLNKRKIRCACLGAVFNLPMSTVTIVEDAVMILMSGIGILAINW